MRNLITYEEISKLARPCTTDEDMAAAMIAEAQRVEIKPRLGDALYMRLIEAVQDYLIMESGDAALSSAPSDTSEDFLIIDAGGAADITKVSPFIIKLLEGGQWLDSSGAVHWLTGVKTALAYYALARIVRDGNIQSTTYGAVVKDDQYSADPERTERQRQYRELFSQADSYMAEALAYLAQNSEAFPEYKTCAKMRSNRTTFKIIGK